MITRQKPVTLDGTNGGRIPLNRDLPHVQISFSGRNTGVLTFTGRAVGSDLDEPFQPALTLDLSTNERTVFFDGSFEHVNVAISVGGDDIQATASQWYTQ